MEAPCVPSAGDSERKAERPWGEGGRSCLGVKAVSEWRQPPQPAVGRGRGP